MPQSHRGPILQRRMALMKRWLRLCSVLVMLSATGGCTWTAADNSQRHLVIGFGIVDVAPPPQQREVNVYRLHALGIFAGFTPLMQGVSIGWLGIEGISIPPETDATVEMISNRDQFRVWFNHKHYMDELACEEQ